MLSVICPAVPKALATTRDIRRRGVFLSNKQEPETTFAEAVEKMQSLFAEGQKWSSLSVTLNDVAEDNKALVKDFSRFDPNFAVPLVASLLTVPKYQSNCLRLELLAALAWRHCEGTKEPTIDHAVHWFNEIGKSRSASGEDPAEDVFVSLVTGKNSHFRILEGLWESAGFYTQTLYDIVQTMPNEGHWAAIKKRVDAILTVSEIVCQNAGIVRYQMGEEYPHQVLLSQQLPECSALVEIVRIPFKILEERGVQVGDIAPFIFNHERKDKVDHQRASETSLHINPLAILDSETVTVVLPTCLSIAMRNYVISEVISGGLEDAFDTMLANQFSALLYDTPLLGGPRHASLRWSKIDQHQVSSLGFQFDEGHYVSLHFFLPSIRTHMDGGFSEGFVDDGSLTSALQKDMLDSMKRFEREDGFQAGMTLLIGGGWGKVYALQHFDVQRENWRFESIPIADLVRVSWMPDIEPAYFWRIHDGLSAVGSKGVQIINPNGILNLIGWVRSNNGHFVPHAQLPPEPITPERPLMLNPPLNMLRDVRAEADNAYDKHCAVDESGKCHVVLRRTADSFFESEGSNKLYVSMTDVLDGTITSLYEGEVQLWLSLNGPNIQDRSVTYHLSKMAGEWLHRIGSVVDREYADRIRVAFARINLVFLDSDVPDGGNAKPIRSDLEKLCRIEVLRDRRCATVTFNAGFIEGFRVAENIAERVVARAMISGFFQILLGRLPGGTLDLIEKEVVPNDEARSFHLFQSQGFMDNVRQLLPDKLSSVDEVDDGIAKLGLAWRVREPADGLVIEGRRACTSFLNDVVDCLIGDIRQELETLPRQAFLNVLVKNIEKANAEEDHWQRTSAAILGLHGKSPETLRKYAHRTSEYAAAGIASRVLTEMSVCMCPIAGTRKPTALSLSRLISRTLLIVRLGGLSDAIRFNALQPELNLSVLGDILFKNDFGELIVEPLLERVLGDRFIQIAPKQKKNYEEPEVGSELKGSIEKRFWDLWVAEMGFDPDQARNIIGSLEDIAFENQTPILELKKSEFIKVAVCSLVDQKAAESFLNQFSLTPRSRWDQVPKGFDIKDIYPWRFGRRLSFVVRPIIQLDESNDPLLLVPPCSLLKGFAYLFGRVYSGSVDQSFLRTPEMRNDWWGMANEGHQFAASVEEEISKKGWQVESNVPLTKILNRKLPMDYGDVDVLAWREDRSEVLVIECKNLQSARNYSEIAAMLSEYQGKTKDGKRDKLKRHLDRVELLSRNQAELGRYIKQDHTEVVSALCCSGPVPMQYSKIEALQNTEVCSAEELLKL